MNKTFANVLQVLRLRSNIQDHGKVPVHKSFPENRQEGVLPTGLPEINLSDVAVHDDFNDCWIVIYDRVYDVTKFLRLHPGGEDMLMDYAGRDATIAFHGTGHSQDAVEQLADYLIGELPMKERIFRKENPKIKLRGIPE